MSFTLSNEVLNYIENSKEEVYQLLEELCQIPAPSGKEEKRAKFCKDWFCNNGFSNAYIDDALNVVCPYDCDDKDDLVVFMAHTDVVFPDTAQLPLVKNGDIWACPGIGDDTACLVLMMMVMKYVANNNLKSDKGILFVANSSEEGLGNLKGCRKIMQDYSNKITEFYTFDGRYHHLVNKCVGSHRYEVSVTSQGGHSFGNFGNTNAIAVMSKLINELYSFKVPVIEDSKTTYNVGVIDGGTSVNTIAQSCKTLYEYRSDNADCLAKSKEFFENTVKKVQSTTDAKIEVKLIGDRPCAGKVDRKKLQEMTDFVVETCKKYTKKDCVVESGSTDCNIPTSLGIPSVCVGTYDGGGVHTREEFLYLSSLEIGYKITAEVILKYFN